MSEILYGRQMRLHNRRVLARRDEDGTWELLFKSLEGRKRHGKHAHGRKVVFHHLFLSDEAMAALVGLYFTLRGRIA